MTAILNMVEAITHLQSAVQRYVDGRADDGAALGCVARVRDLVARADVALGASDAASVRSCLAEIQGVAELLAGSRRVATESFQGISASLAAMRLCLLAAPISKPEHLQ